MGYLTELRPFRGLEPSDPRDWMSDLFRRFWSPGLETANRWAPAVDVREAPESFVIKLEIPGIDPGEVQITLTGDTLTVQGEKKSETLAENEHVHYAERVHGAFQRSFSFPTAVASDTVEAETQNGVLTIRVMKAKEARPRKVQIKSR